MAARKKATAPAGLCDKDNQRERIGSRNRIKLAGQSPLKYERRMDLEQMIWVIEENERAIIGTSDKTT